MDLRGYNLSDRPASRSAYALQNLCSDVAAVVRSTEAHRAHIIGHDWGGVIAWTFASKYAELTNKLIIINAPHMAVYMRKAKMPPQLFNSWYIAMFSIPGVAEHLLSANNFFLLRKMFSSFPFQKAAFSQKDIDEYVRIFSSPGALTAALNYYRANLTNRGALSLGRDAHISAPTLVLWGEKDPALSLGLLSGLDEFASHLTIRRFANASHWLQNELPDVVNDEIIRFLR